MAQTIAAWRGAGDTYGRLQDSRILDVASRLQQLEEVHTATRMPLKRSSRMEAVVCGGRRTLVGSPSMQAFAAQDKGKRRVSASAWVLLISSLWLRVQQWRVGCHAPAISSRAGPQTKIP